MWKIYPYTRNCRSLQCHLPRSQALTSCTKQILVELTAVAVLTAVNPLGHGDEANLFYDTAPQNTQWFMETALTIEIIIFSRWSAWLPKVSSRLVMYLWWLGFLTTAKVISAWVEFKKILTTFHFWKGSFFEVTCAKKLRQQIKIILKGLISRKWRLHCKLSHLVPTLKKCNNLSNNYHHKKDEKNKQ